MLVLAYYVVHGCTSSFITANLQQILVTFTSRTTAVLSPSRIRTPGIVFFNKSKRREEQTRSKTSAAEGGAAWPPLFSIRGHHGDISPTCVSTHAVGSDHLCEVPTRGTCQFRLIWGVLVSLRKRKEQTSMQRPPQR